MHRKCGAITFTERLAFVPMLILLFAITRPSGAQTSACAGINKEPHPYGTYTFETTSRLDPMQVGRYNYGVVSCADHNDPNNFLYINWLIPGPHGWAPPNGKLESAARLRKDNQAPQLKGCLLYGNRPDITAGLFFGVDGDDRRVNYERQHGCAGAVASDEPGNPGVIEKIFLNIRNFFPSDASKAQSTMLQLDGDVGVEPLGANNYRSVFYYKVSRYQGSEGSAADVSVQPAFRGRAEALLSAFNKSNSSGIKFGTDGVIAFEVTDVRDPQLYYASYEIYDREKRLVAGIDFPVFVSGR